MLWYTITPLEFLPYSVILDFLEQGFIDDQKWLEVNNHFPPGIQKQIEQGQTKPWLMETRSHNTMLSGTRMVKLVI